MWQGAFFFAACIAPWAINSAFNKSLVWIVLVSSPLSHLALALFVRHSHDFQTMPTDEFAVAKTHFPPSNRRFCGMFKLLVT
jgi:hypothetical protein